MVKRYEYLDSTYFDRQSLPVRLNFISNASSHAKIMELCDIMAYSGVVKRALRNLKREMKKANFKIAGENKKQVE